MRAVTFGRINVTTAGTIVKMGTSTLNGNITLAALTLATADANPFTESMCPFKLHIDESGTRETVMVTNVSGTTLTIQRGIDGTTPAAHLSGVSLVAKFMFCGWRLSVVAGLSGKMYWGSSSSLVSSTGVGVIKEFWPNSSGGVDDAYDFLGVQNQGNTLNLSDYAMDAAISGEGLYVTIWVN
jgi:hypothetical protein